MTFGRSVRRKAGRFVKKLRRGGVAELPNGELANDPMASHVAQLAGIRVMDIPPAAAGEDSGERDRIHDPGYRARLNDKKRQRRAEGRMTPHPIGAVLTRAGREIRKDTHALWSEQGRDERGVWFRACVARRSDPRPMTATKPYAELLESPTGVFTVSVVRNEGTLS